METFAHQYGREQGWLDHNDEFTPEGLRAFELLYELRDQEKTCPKCDKHYLGHDYICRACRYG
jgi:hypothetical protein